MSEKQARVVSLPSQTCLYKQQICEASFVIKAEITTVKGNFLPLFLLNFCVKFNLFVQIPHVWFVTRRMGGSKFTLCHLYDHCWTLNSFL